MLLHFDEFCQTDTLNSKTLNYYHKLPESLHLMETKEIISHINRYGSAKVWVQKQAIMKYFKWLHKTYDIDMSKQLYELKQFLKENDVDYIGFFSLNDLSNGIEQSYMTLEMSEHPKAHADYTGLYAVFYLEWFGIEAQSIPSIQLEDVTDMGHKVYVPAENRTVEITDEGVAEFLWEYKNKTGASKEGSKVITPYKGNTFYRTTRPNKTGNVDRQIYNARSRFVQACEDKRFSKNNVYLSGRFYQMLMTEEKMAIKLKTNQTESYKIVREIFNTPDMPDATVSNWIGKYYLYKRTYLSR